MKSFLKKTLSPGKADFKSSMGLLLLRLYLGGVMLIYHGIDKFSAPQKVPNPFNLNPTFNGWLVLFAEIFCAALILIGLATRLSCAVLAFCMGVAFFVFHADDGFPAKEKAFIYLVGYLALMLTGAGQLSLDRFLGKSS